MTWKSPEGITLLESKLIPYPFEKVVHLIQAHRTNFSKIHPHAKSVRQEGDAFVAEEEFEIFGIPLSLRTKFTVN